MATVAPAKAGRSPWAREYETIYIMRPDITAEAAEQVANRVVEVVKKCEGQLTKVDNWGRRKLAYPIGKNSRGVFVYLKYIGYNDIVAELERNLHMIEPVVRWQTVKIRDEVDPKEITIDPEDVKFRALEDQVEEEEETLEQRLGLAPRKASAMAEGDEESADLEGDGGDDRGEAVDSDIFDGLRDEGEVE